MSKSHNAIERIKKIASMSEADAKAYLRSEKRVEPAEGSAGSLERAGSATPFCVRWRCEKAKLHWLKKGHSLQTENGHFTAGGDGWICPRCGGGYGKTPSPNPKLTDSES